MYGLFVSHDLLCVLQRRCRDLFAVRGVGLTVVADRSMRNGHTKVVVLAKAKVL